MAEAPFNTRLIVDLFDARNDPASIAYGFLQFEGDPERTTRPVPPLIWEPLRILPDRMAHTKRDDEPGALKARTISALLASTEGVMEEAGGMPADTLVGIGPIADRWGDGLVWRMLEERGDAGTVPSRFILAHLGPRNKRVLLLSNVLKNGRPEVSTINEIRENEGSDVVGVVSVADMNRGASDYIAAETGVTAVRSAISAVGVFTSLRAVKRISPDYAAFGLRWAHNPRAPSVLSKDQVPFSTQTDLS